MTQIPSTRDTKYTRSGRAFGMAIGTLFLGVFGTAWVALSLQSTGQLHSVAIFLLAVFLAALIAASVYTLARTHTMANDESNAAARKKMNRAMGRINGAQWGMILLVGYGLHHFHRDAFILPAIILIVGIHFLPLARVFQSWPDAMTGVFLVLWACTYPLVLPTNLADPVGAFVTGLLLLSCAAIHALLALQLMR